MDFNEEIAEFIAQKYIVSFGIKQQVTPVVARCEIVTLESTLLEFDWSQTAAIKLTHVNKQRLPESRVYETIEQLLTDQSPGYKDAFGGSLMAKLEQLQKEQQAGQE